MKKKYSVLLLLALFTALQVTGQTKKEEKQRKQEVVLDENGKQIFDDVKERSKIKYNFVPMPFYDPTSKWGISLINMFNYYPDKNDLVSPPSSTVFAISGTTNKSLMGGFKQSLYLKEDLWRINAMAFYGQINSTMLLLEDPQEVGSPVVSVDPATGIFSANLMVERRVFSRVYVGVGYLFNGRKVEGSNEEERAILQRNGFSEDWVSAHGLRYSVTFDSRDNIYYPYAGLYFKTNIDQMMGENATNIYTADYRQFFTLGDNVSNVLAVHGFGRFVSESASRNYWSSYGRSGPAVQRGYEQGKYMDRNLITAEAEFRKETPWMNHKLGFVGALSMGKVFGSNNGSGQSYNFQDAEWLPAIALGVRYRLLPYERMNLKFDYAQGKDGAVFYFGISEAF
ncbi:BamA/TamA family outer membrane protein [Persicobacter diffluens]|uniref:Membrane protein n=1 Tax=Persicobacter diffluens TaxID=981 RepID=A0AAN4W3E1_9BACT|nr:membrane protein [Persicobacter diffluens]